MMGIPVYYGSPVSTYAESNLSTAGIGTLIAASRQPGLNELACVRFAKEFGRDKVFVISTTREKGHAKHSVSGEVQGRRLFGENIRIDQLISAIKSGATIKQTLLTDEFGIEEFSEQNPNSLIVFALTDDEKLRFPVVGSAFEPRSGWTLSYFTEVKQD